VCPSGLFAASKTDGTMSAITVPLTIQYRKLGSSTWITLEDIASIASDNPTDKLPTDGGGSVGSNPPVDTPVTQIDPNKPGQTQTFHTKGAAQNATYGAKTSISDKNRSPVRRSFSTPRVPFGQYEIRIQRDTAESLDEYTSDKVYISDINEVTASVVAYNNTALVGLKVKLTNQLSQLPTVTYINHGRIIRLWDPVTGWGMGNSSNPAWIALDMLTHTRYGGQLDESRIDLEQFKDWAKHCVDQSLQFNGVFDSKMTMWDALQYVCRLGHAQLVNIGTRWGVAIERADTPMMMFGSGNIVEGSFKLNWLPLTERANEVEVTFFDSADGYKQKTIKTYDPAILNNGRPQRNAQFTLFGCTSELTAVKEGFLALNLNRYVTQTCEFDTPIEALACTVGSLVYVQHDMPVWASSGRLAAGSTTTSLNLDRAIDLDIGANTVLVHANSVQVATGQILTIDNVNTT
jgi:predicted phage tail protein